MGTQLFTNQGRTTLAAALTADATTLTLADGSVLPDIAAGSGDWFKLVLQDSEGYEIVYATAHSLSTSPSSVTVTRSQEGTVARAFAAGAVVGNRMTAQDAAKWRDKLAAGDFGLGGRAKVINYGTDDLNGFVMASGVWAQNTSGASNSTALHYPTTNAGILCVGVDSFASRASQWYIETSVGSTGVIWHRTCLSVSNGTWTDWVQVLTSASLDGLATADQGAKADTALQAAANLADVPDKAAARANLGITDGGAATTGVAGDSRPALVPAMQRLLVYYGAPIGWRSLGSAAAVIADIAANYDIWIVGDMLEAPTNSHYATTQAIVQGVRALGVLVYGYISIGVSTDNFPIATIQTNIDNWVTLGVDGIFVDEFGFGYKTPRSRQVAVTDYIHSKGLPYCANAAQSAYVIYDTADQVPSGVIYNDELAAFTTYNPDGQILNRQRGDSVMLEGFGIDNAAPVAFSSNLDKRVIEATVRCQKQGMWVWALATVPESPEGVIDYTKTGTLTTEALLSSFLAALAYIAGVTVLGVGGNSYGSDGPAVVLPTPALPASSAYASDAIQLATNTYTRNFGNVSLAVTADGTTTSSSYRALGAVPQFEPLLLTGAKAMEVVASLPADPDPNTIYFTTS